MRTGPLGRTDLVVSALGMGCVKLGAAGAGLSRREATRLVRDAVDRGVRLFDTADAYGSGVSETVLGQALEAVPDEVVIATKVGYRFDERGRLEAALRSTAGRTLRAVERHKPDAPDRVSGGTYGARDFTAEHVRPAVIASLRRLRVERIDLLQFHGPPPTDAAELPEVVQELIDDGVVRWFGVGCETLESAASWVGVRGVAAVQLPFGVLDPQAAGRVIPAASAAGVGVIARGVLGGGLLARFVRGQDTGLDAIRAERVRALSALAESLGVDLMQIAVWYGAHRAPVDAVLLGITSPGQLADDVRLASTPSPGPDVLAEITRLVESAGDDL